MIPLLLACSTPPAPVPPPPAPAPAPPEVQPSPEPVVEAPPALLNDPPFGFVDVSKIPNIAVQPRYHGSDNFSGAPFPGYGASAVWLDKRAAEALAGVAETLQREGLGLLVYDGYRPVRATKAMVAWTERTGQQNLIRDGYIAAKSGHNTGHTVDLTLTKDGQPLDMGTPWDAFSTDSHTSNATGVALENRERLAKAMRSGSYRGYSKEWWHFSFGKGGPARDVPYGCFEPPEGEWTPPKDWTSSSYKAPTEWTATSCSQ